MYFPDREMLMTEIADISSLGELIRRRRVALGLRQPDLALAANVGVRFIVDIEKGKPTCQIGRVLRLLETLGITLIATMPPEPETTEAAEVFDPEGYMPP